VDYFRAQLENLNLSGTISITSPHASGELAVPQEVVLEKNDDEIWIKYRFPYGGRSKKPQGALAHFLALADEKTDDERFRTFAQQWGVLCFCEEHNLVASHDHHKLCFPRNDVMNARSFLKSMNAAATELSRTQVWANRMRLAEEDIWFKEPISRWRQYARRMKALITIFLSFKGEFRGDVSASWKVLRQFFLSIRREGPNPIYESVEEIQQAPLQMQIIALADILRLWIQEANLFPNIEWSPQVNQIPAPDLAFQCSLRASYFDVGLLFSPHLMLFSVLVAQCITALGPNTYFRQCSCVGCSAHQGNCSELLEVRQTVGRPSHYCDICRPYIRQQQKNTSRKKRRMERSNQQE
jgi:hypothetical protein